MKEQHLKYIFMKDNKNNNFINKAAYKVCINIL